MGVTVTYTAPVAGTTPPTAAQAANCNAVTGNIIASATGDTDAVVTHNFGFSAGDTAKQYPWVFMGALNVAYYVATWVYVRTDGNTVTFTKITGANTYTGSAQLEFTIERPFSKDT